VKWRDAAGVEHKKVLGRVHASRRPARPGYLTRQEAQRQLDEILAQARRVGPGARRAVGAQPTFADAAREWLRYVEVDRRRRPSTPVRLTGSSVWDKQSGQILRRVTGVGALQEKTACREAVLSDAADGTRTHDLLHGKCRLFGIDPGSI
jgi:hypothetical protein